MAENNKAKVEEPGKSVPMTLTPMGKDDMEVAVPVTVPSELFDYVPTTEDIQLPRIRLAQGLTPEVGDGTAKPGDWLVPGKPAQKTLTATVLGIRRTRNLWKFDEMTQMRSTVCSSPDSITGVGEPGGDCATCPMAKWTPNPEGNGNRPPACTLIYGYLLQTPEGDIGVYDASTRSANNIIGQLNAFFLQAGGGNIEVTLGSQLISKGARRYYSPTLVHFRTLKDSPYQG